MKLKSLLLTISMLFFVFVGTAQNNLVNIFIEKKSDKITLIKTNDSLKVTLIEITGNSKIVSNKDKRN